jgi:hypothetical protein
VRGEWLRCPVRPIGGADDEADPDIVRTGRAVIERYADLGLTPRELQQDHVIDPHQFARSTQDNGWPQPAALHHRLKTIGRIYRRTI